MAINIKLDIKTICCILLYKKPELMAPHLKSDEEWKDTVDMFRKVFIEKYPDCRVEIEETFNSILGD
jgi:hypothetical protein